LEQFKLENVLIKNDRVRYLIKSRKERILKIEPAKRRKFEMLFDLENLEFIRFETGLKPHQEEMKLWLEEQLLLEI
jgi:hypothetical protein